MSMMLFELLMAMESSPGLIKAMHFEDGALYLTRGHKAVSDLHFDLSNSYVTDGRDIFRRDMSRTEMVAAPDRLHWFNRLRLPRSAQR